MESQSNEYEEASYVKPPEPEDIPAPTLAGHQWKQYGNKLECISCPYTHVSFLPPRTFLKGMKDGIPILEKH